MLSLVEWFTLLTQVRTSGSLWVEALFAMGEQHGGHGRPAPLNGRWPRPQRPRSLGRDELSRIALLGT